MPLPKPIADRIQFFRSVRSVLLNEAPCIFTAGEVVEFPRTSPYHPYRSKFSILKCLSHRARLLVFLLATSAAQARPPAPPQRVPLTPFGFQTISERYLLQGATMVTVDFVDNGHLLVTFGISRLMPRLPECPSDDEDRTVKAALLEISSGRELASTEWRLHDLGQYLWNVGDGHFLLRNRDTLTVFTPLQVASKTSNDAFAQTPFLKFSRRIEAILVSADHDLVAIETTKRKVHVAVAPMLQVSAQALSTPATPPNPLGLQRRDPNAAPDPQPPVEITFLRLLRPDPASVVARLEARVRTEKVVNIPVTTEGFLDTRAESRDGVLFHFITYAGKDIDLGDFPTSCHPRPTFVSKSEFVTYGCRGADDSLDLAGFNLRGDMIWQINFTDMQAYPSFASAPAAGRFAFSRTITTSNVFGSETPSMSQLTAQEIRVIQMYNGKQLVRAVASPIQRAGQNYALSPDGLALAVIHDTPAPPAERGEKPLHDTAVELFRLPALTPRDLAEIKTEAAMAPPPANAPMRFSLKEIKEVVNPAPAADSAIVGDNIPGDAPTQISSQPPALQPSARPSVAESTSDSIVGESSTTAPANSSRPGITAEPEPEKRRKPPTLYEPAPADAPKPPQP